jgi:hypothetical protein
MQRVRSVVLLLALTITAAACGQPPDREMQQAQGAIDAARAAGADQYAREEFAAAQDALKRSHDAVAIRDYRLALNHALDSRERAQNAAKEAADRMAAARVDADRALSSATAALTAAQAALKAAETPRTPARLLAGSRRTIADAERRVQEARTAFERDDYAAVVSAAAAVTEDLQAATKDLRAAQSPPARRRR